MGKVDMSAEAVTARLKLVSELTKLCLSLKSARIKPRQVSKKKKVSGDIRAQPDSK